jgi:hypothetical protein
MTLACAALSPARINGNKAKLSIQGMHATRYRSEVQNSPSPPGDHGDLKEKV